MQTFKLDLDKRRNARRNAYLATSGLLALPILYDLLFPNDVITSYYYVFAGAFVLINLLRDILKEKVFQIAFDSSKREISLLSGSLLSKAKHKRIPFNNARLELIDEWKFLFFSGCTELCFMMDKMEVASITEHARGFSKETIIEIVEVAELNKITVTRL